MTVKNAASTSFYFHFNLASRVRPAASSSPSSGVFLAIKCHTTHCQKASSSMTSSVLTVQWRLPRRPAASSSPSSGVFLAIQRGHPISWLVISRCQQHRSSPPVASFFAAADHFLPPAVIPCRLQSFLAAGSIISRRQLCRFLCWSIHSSVCLSVRNTFTL